MNKCKEQHAENGEPRDWNIKLDFLLPLASEWERLLTTGAYSEWATSNGSPKPQPDLARHFWRVLRKLDYQTWLVYLEVSVSVKFAAKFRRKRLQPLRALAKYEKRQSYDDDSAQWEYWEIHDLFEEAIFYARATAFSIEPTLKTVALPAPPRRTYRRAPKCKHCGSDNTFIKSSGRRGSNVRYMECRDCKERGSTTR